MGSVISSGLVLLALIAVLGALLQTGSLWRLRTASTSAWAASPLQRRADGYLFITLGLLTLATSLALVTRSSAISQLPWNQLGPVLPQILRQTHFGHVWWLRAAVIVVFWAACPVLRSLRRHRTLAGLGILCVLIEAWGWSVTAHPGDHGNFTLDVWVAVTHIFAAGLWGGTVLAVAVVVAPVRHRLGELDAADVMRLVRRFSSISALGLALIVTSGVYNACSQMVQFSDFWTSTFGRILGIKLALFLLLAGIGACNRFRRVPHLMHALRMPAAGTGWQQQAVRQLLRAVVWEALVLLLIVAVVSVLVHTLPPAAAAGIP